MIPMHQTATKVTSTRNAYGDYVAGARTDLVCHFRYITNLDISDNESIQSDAMAWFEPDSGVVKGDILIIDGEGFIVEKLTKARRLRNPVVLFLKTELKRYAVIS